jgi:Tfp pilus assembly protein PilZ
MACWVIHGEDVACYQTFDLSATGLCIRSTQHLPEGEIVELQFYLPDSARPLSVTAKVVWSVECGEGGIGLVFLEHGRETVARLLRAAERNSGC